MTFIACCTTRSKWLAYASAAALLSFSHCSLGSAQTSTQIYSKLEAATKSSNLLYADKPWHLKLEVQVLDDQGLVSQQGTVERWQSGDDSRTVSSFGPSTSVAVEHGGQTYRLIQGGGIPATAELLLNTVLHPGPYPEDTAGTTPELRPTNFGKLRMDCIMLSRPLAPTKTTPLGVFPSYCLDGANRINIVAQGGNDLVIQTKTGTFQGLVVGVESELLRGGRVTARGKVTQLAVFTPKPDEFEPSPELAATLLTVRVSGAVEAGYKASGKAPTYPEVARQERITGTVVLQALVGTDGHIHSLVPLSGPDPSLVVAALQAVRDWLYKPYTLNGVPVEVKTIITVNFHLNPG